MVETTEYVEDSGTVTVYGICCHDEVVPNISANPVVVEALVEKLNCHGADPIHLKDLIDDCLP